MVDVVIMEIINETGRSMVEMLGVLAIIGVLSVGGITGYKMAMEKNKVNNIIEEQSKAAVIASATFLENPNLFDTRIDGEQWTNSNLGGPFSVTSPFYDDVISQSGIDELDDYDICVSIHKSGWKMPFVSGSTGNFKAYEWPLTENEIEELCSEGKVYIGFLIDLS